MIHVYTHTALLTPANRRHVHPLLFDLHYYEHAHPLVKQHYCLVDDPTLAQIFILPLNYITVKQELAFNQLYDLAVKHHKKLHVYTGGDYGKTFKDCQVVVWRNAGFKSRNDSQTIIVPAFMNDPVAAEQVVFKTIAYSIKPEISFTGFATPSHKEWLRCYVTTVKTNIKRFLGLNNTDKQRFYNAARKRFDYLKKLEQSKELTTNFIYRDKYRAGAQNEEQRKQTTKAFFVNLNNSPYAFCMRGAGNFSVRFYEALACGRIPILVDTDVVLPLESVIMWDQHICRVQQDEDIVERLLHFHKQHDHSSFKALQESNRLLYEETLVRHHYFCAVHDDLISSL